MIIGTPDDDDEPSVVVIRVNGATASKSCALVKLIVTRLLFPLLLFESNKVVVGIDLKSVFEILNVLAFVVVIGKRALVHG